MSENQSDSEAIAASLADPSAFGLIFERHYDAVLGYLQRRLDGQFADELAAQTFLVAFDGRSRFDRSRPDSRPWLFGIATNLAHNHRRREIVELRAVAALTPEGSAGVDGVEARIDAERMRGLLAQALADLPSEEADVLCLLVWAELSQTDRRRAGDSARHRQVPALPRPRATAGRPWTAAGGRPGRRQRNFEWR
jgi:RNA polymerase sigma-70 factor (ECF subfamily)